MPVQYPSKCLVQVRLVLLVLHLSVDRTHRFGRWSGWPLIIRNHLAKIHSLQIWVWISSLMSSVVQSYLDGLPWLVAEEPQILLVTSPPDESDGLTILPIFCFNVKTNRRPSMIPGKSYRDFHRDFHGTLSSLLLICPSHYSMYHISN